VIKLYRFAISGHCHRVQMFLSLIHKEFELVDVDLPGGEHKKDDFLKRSPFGKVPVLDDDGTVIWDSNAILTYLALKYADESWYPRDPETSAEVQKWLSVAAGDLSNGPAAARQVCVFGAKLDHDRAKSIAAGLFGVMERHLDDRDFLLGDVPTIADVACYSYTAKAPEGDVSLQPYPNIQAWLDRVEALAGFVEMQAA